MNNRIRILSLLLVSLYLLPGSTYSAPQAYEEYAVKTAFLYRSLHYVEWNTKNTDTNLIVICTTNSDKFSKTIQSLHDRIVNSRTISLQIIASHDDINECDVLYVPMQKKAKLRKILSNLENKNILTISDRRGFAKNGIILNFPVDNQKVVIEINIDAANKQNLRFSAKLLRIAKIVGN